MMLSKCRHRADLASPQEIPCTLNRGALTAIIITKEEEEETALVEYIRHLEFESEASSFKITLVQKEKTPNNSRAIRGATGCSPVRPANFGAREKSLGKERKQTTNKI